MGLEAATYINQLNASNPVGASDPKAQGDDHIRLIKSTIQASFPNIAGAMTVSHTALNSIATPTTPANKVKATGAAGAGVAATVLHSDAQLLVDLADAYAWTGAHTWSVALKAGNGTVGAPSYSFTGDPDTGMYGNADNTVRFATNGVITLLLDSVNSRNVSYFPIQINVDGASGAPAYTFVNDTDTGIFRVSANQMGFSAEGTTIFDVRGLSTGSQGIVMNAGVLYIRDGLVGTPALAFSGDTDTGIYRSGSGDYRFVTNGSIAGGILATGAYNLQSDGTAGSPHFAFFSDTDTGFYRIGSGRIGLALDGAAFEVGFRSIPQNSQSVNYTCVQQDSGKHILHPNGGGAGDTFTIPANAAVAYDLGTVITFVNRDASSVSIAITSDTLILAGTTTTGTRTLAQNGMATAIKVEATVWLISGSGLS